MFYNILKEPRHINPTSFQNIDANEEVLHCSCACWSESWVLRSPISHLLSWDASFTQALVAYKKIPTIKVETFLYAASACSQLSSFHRFWMVIMRQLLLYNLTDGILLLEAGMAMPSSGVLKGTTIDVLLLLDIPSKCVHLLCLHMLWVALNHFQMGNLSWEHMQTSLTLLRCRKM